MYFVFEASTGTLRALGAESGTVDGLKNSLFNHTNVPPERQILLDEQGIFELFMKQFYAFRTCF